MNSSVNRSGTGVDALRGLNNQPTHGFPETGVHIYLEGLAGNNPVSVENHLI